MDIKKDQPKISAETRRMLIDFLMEVGDYDNPAPICWRRRAKELLELIRNPKKKK